MHMAEIMGRINTRCYQYINQMPLNSSLIFLCGKRVLAILVIKQVARHIVILSIESRCALYALETISIDKCIIC